MSDTNKDNAMSKAEEIYSKKGLEAYRKVGIEGEWLSPPEWCIEAMKEYHQARLQDLREKIIAGIPDDNYDRFDDGVGFCLDKVLKIIDNATQ